MKPHIRFTERIAAQILEEIATGRSLSEVCRADGMPTCRAVFQWVDANPDFANRYRQAQDFRAQLIFDEILEIADTPQPGTRTKIRSDGSNEETTGDQVERSRLRLDARKWCLARMSPKKYGDRISTEISGPDGKPIQSESSHGISAEMQEAILLRTSEAARIAAGVTPPASFRGHEADSNFLG